MPTEWHFRFNDTHVSYRTHEEIVEFLVSRQEAIAQYRETMFGVIASCLSWSDYKGAREAFEMLLSVLQALDERAGRRVLT